MRTLFVLCLTFQALAVNCVDAFFEILNNSVSRTEVQYLRDNANARVESINELIDGTQNLVYPAEVTDQFTPYEAEPSFGFLSHEFDIGGRLLSFEPGRDPEDVIMDAFNGGKLRIYSNHPIHALSVTAHEYGHGILEASLRRALPGLSELREVYIRDIHPIVEEVRRLNRLLDNDPLLENRAEYEEAVIEYKGFVEARMEEIYDEENIYGYIYHSNLFTPHHEFFADLIAVISGDRYSPSAIHDAIVMTRDLQVGGQDVQVLNRQRDFSYSRNRFETWVNSRKKNFHGMFAPVRYFIHEEYLKRPQMQRPENLAKILDAVFEALLEDYSYIVANVQSYEELHPSVRVERFLEILRNKLEAVSF